MRMEKKMGITMMLFATLFWGMMAISSRHLSNIHFNDQDISFLRVSASAVITTILLAFTNRSAFKVSFKGFLFCIFYGILNFAIGFTFYGIAVRKIPIAVATVLMFSNPVWVTIFSRLFFNEKITLKKAITIILCIFGCMCIIDIFATGGMNLDAIGILCGVGNGMTFAMQIVMPRFVDGKIEKETILLYGFWGATISLIFFIDIPNMVTSIMESSNPQFFILNILSVCILSTFMANTLYVKSTKYIGTSLPSMMVAFEPVFASFLAFLVFSENMNLIQLTGALIVIFSVVSLEIDLRIVTSKFANFLIRKDTNPY